MPLIQSMPHLWQGLENDGNNQESQPPGKNKNQKHRRNQYKCSLEEKKRLEPRPLFTPEPTSTEALNGDTPCHQSQIFPSQIIQ